MLLSFLGPSVSIGPIKVSFARGWPAYPCCNGAVALANLRLPASHFHYNADFIFEVIGISWSQIVLWPLLFSCASDCRPNKFTCYSDTSDILKFASWFYTPFFSSPVCLCAIKYTWLFKCLEFFLPLLVPYEDNEWIL